MSEGIRSLTDICGCAPTGVFYHFPPVGAVKKEFDMADQIRENASAFGQIAVADPDAITALNPTVPAALSQSAAPSGGTGNTAGAYDTASNRNLMIASINAGRADLIALRAEVVSYEVAISALVVDVASIRTQLVAALEELRRQDLLSG